MSEEAPAVFSSLGDARQIAHLFLSLAQLVAHEPDTVFDDTEVQDAGRKLSELIDSRLDIAAQPVEVDRCRLLTPVVDIAAISRARRPNPFPQRPEEGR